MNFCNILTTIEKGHSIITLSQKYKNLIQPPLLLALV